MNLLESHTDLEQLEYTVMGVLVLLQIYLAIKLYYKIYSYKSTFRNLPIIREKQVPIEIFNHADVNEVIDYHENKNEELDIDDAILVDSIYIDANSNNIVLNKICQGTNSYLLKIKAASIDFHILKDITDRNIDIVEEEINNRIPAPLYIGLAATMIGIIIGLWSINFEATTDNSTVALDTIKPLINGVKIAMSASVFGLLITTVFSVFVYKKAKTKVDEDKSDFLSLLQSELLPKMNQSKLPEVHVLSSKLDAFSRNTTGMVSKLDGIVRASSNAVFREQKLIEEIKTLDVKKVAQVNLDVFNKLEGMMETFGSFSTHYQQLDKSLANTNALVQHLEKFVANTHNINAILDDIKGSIARNNESTAFFNSHIGSLSKYSDAVNQAVASTDSKMSKAIDELVESANKQFESFNQAIAVYDSKLTKAFENSIAKFTEVMDLQVVRSEKAFDDSTSKYIEVMDTQIKRTEEAFNNSKPKFEKLEQLDRLEKLDNLDKLNDINNRLNSLESKLSEVIGNGNSKIVEALSHFNPNIKPIAIQEETVNTKSKKSFLTTITTGLKLTAYLIIITGGIFFIYINL
ncbi:hypothetical protein [Formosa algae]|uniref:hypothetical protein n=1 Tax=Formosa algae TaxID=225843 RepID=UPI000CCF4F12|nr:hypothetical protein [Formosa algae]PNW28028.1 hypothetical protein BKP44_10260 [Formosa algae]